MTVCSKIVPMTFPRRGCYRQEAFRIVTRFRSDSCRSLRHINLKTEALVYPSVGPSEEYLEVLPGIQGALESLAKGRGQDLYALRDYVPTDSARSRSLEGFRALWFVDGPRICTRR